MLLQNDMLQWLLDSPDGQAESVPDMAQRLLSLNFASIHTTSMVTLRQVILESHTLIVIAARFRR